MIRDYRERIARFNHQLNAFIDLTDEPVDRGLAWAVKSNIAVRGLPCTGGIGAYRDNIASQDAAVIQMIRRAGGQTILGTVNMHEGALGATTDNKFFGVTQNPWAEGYTPGGSSGGSGAAVAAGLCDIALGTDTMGSIRIPASYCGVQGFKPTQGLLSLEGIMPLSHTLDHVGPLARDVHTLWQGMATLAAWPPDEAMNVHGLKGLRVSFWVGAKDVVPEPAMLSAIESLRGWLSQSGAYNPETGHFEPPHYAYSASRRAGLLIAEVEAEAFHRLRMKSHAEGFSEIFSRLLKWGAVQKPEKIESAYRHLRAVRAAAAEIWKERDVVIAPVAPQTAFAFAGDVPTNQADFTAWANFAGLPAAAVWAGMSDQGLPFGLQIIGAQGDDRRVLQIASAVESFFGKPPMPARFA